ncbi:hypothetical protein BN7_4051 [Wickerhamomyces ciferrii]|uniref:Uncharacterized protein n=1 Tax=Wickerhamomyces ciferrii (strain ATCC 14091 / BCRC 22168 / CBS 111 / JCM 3599 / NBRC 0793 / NRRL Y-1031 F-60-10) TaxID=1206466 RepID=K0KQS9_WICCF|nr:uncharacterized protein BN7_4051 [Wickerhamomyces ciferrii]CCH44487.1 hypothetical protein BN7_4051 [Wickerhamomyces ciferrii]
MVKAVFMWPFSDKASKDYSKSHISSSITYSSTNLDLPIWTTDCTEKSHLGPLPMEIWVLIMKKGGVHNELLPLNQCFYENLAPVAYKQFSSLQLLLVLSSTERMKQNDACFLKYGPDFQSRPYDSYSIYERHLESLQYEYEFLDVTYDEWEPEELAKPNKFEGTLITKYDKVMFFLNNILPNPKSKLRDSIKSLNIDVSILNGYQELMLNKGSEIDLSLKKAGRMKADNLCKNFQVEADDMLYVYKHYNGVYDGDRWQGPNSVYHDIEQYFSDRISQQINSTFPTKVYHEELTHLSQLFKSYSSNERKDLININLPNQIRKEHPYKKLAEAFGKYKTFNMDEYYNDFGYVAGYHKILPFRINILSRRFSSEADTKSIIKSLIEIMSSEEHCSSIDTSLFITGIPDFKKVEMDFRPRFWFVFQKLYQYTPLMTLLNKPKSQSK